MTDADRRARVARLLGHLFSSVLKPEFAPGRREPYTEDEVALGIAHQLGAAGAGYIRRLRAGNDDLTPATRDALAAFFGVPGDYFEDPAVTSKLNHDIEFLVAVRDSALSRDLWEPAPGPRFGSSLGEPTRVALLDALIELLRNPLSRSTEVT